MVGNLPRDHALFGTSSGTEAAVTLQSRRERGHGEIEIT